MYSLNRKRYISVKLGKFEDNPSSPPLPYPSRQHVILMPLECEYAKIIWKRTLHAGGIQNVSKLNLATGHYFPSIL